jgi:hypothetical protein
MVGQKGRTLCEYYQCFWCLPRSYLAGRYVLPHTPLGLVLPAAWIVDLIGDAALVGQCAYLRPDAAVVLAKSLACSAVSIDAESAKAAS